MEVEYRVTFPRKDRKENNSQRFHSIISAANKLRKLKLAGYDMSKVKLHTRTFVPGEWSEVDYEVPSE